jgi:hypothetical protein
MRDDKSVHIGDNADVHNSAIGNRASVRSTRPRRIIAILTVIGAIIVGWVTNYFYDWTAYVFHFFGRR